MGFNERELMLRVELPLALPIIFTGVRIAAVQVIATEPLAAFFGGDGLGVYLRQGLGNQDFNEVQAGALLVTATAIGMDFLLYLLGRAVLPKGVQAQRRRSSPSTYQAPNPNPQIKEPTRCEPPDGDSCSRCSCPSRCSWLHAATTRATTAAAPVAAGAAPRRLPTPRSGSSPRTSPRA